MQKWDAHEGTPREGSLHKQRNGRHQRAKASSAETETEKRPNVKGHWPSGWLLPCPQSQCFLRTYASILPTSLSVPFSMYQSILCLGTWCGDEYGLQLGFGFFVNTYIYTNKCNTYIFLCSNNTPGFCFNAQNSQQWQYVGWAAFFNLEPPLRTTREVERPKPQQGRRCGLWWKESSPWEDWLVTWQVFRISTKKIKKYFTIFCFLILYVFPHAISFWNIIPGSLLPLFKYGQSVKSPWRDNTADTPSLS